MKTELKAIKKIGYGHWKVTIRFRNGKEYSTTTTNSQAIDDFNSDEFLVKDQIKVQRARKTLIREVKRDNNLL